VQNFKVKKLSNFDMASRPSIFGWDLLYNSISNDVKCNEDILVAFTHLVLVNSGFQCIGIGDSKNLDGNETTTETLPAGWNDGYRLRYLYQGKLYNLQGTKLDDSIMINLLRPDERTVSMVQLNLRSVISRKGNLDAMIPNNKEIVKTIQEQLIDKVTKSNKVKEGSTQTPAQEVQRQDSSSTFPGAYPIYGPQAGGPLRDPMGPLNPLGPLGVGVGRNDLDPLAGIGGPYLGGPAAGFGPLGPGGGGMLFQPPGRHDPARPGVPMGSIPPGARFDPFRPPTADPPIPGRRPNPDNDEMPPPGFDDMYM